MQIVLLRLEITCPLLHIPPTNGNVSCTDINYAGSECNFTCSDAYGIFGTALSVCIDDMNGDANGSWTSSAPICQSRINSFQVFQSKFLFIS